MPAERELAERAHFYNRVVCCNSSTCGQVAVLSFLEGEVRHRHCLGCIMESPRLYTDTSRHDFAWLTPNLPRPLQVVVIASEASFPDMLQRVVAAARLLAEIGVPDVPSRNLEGGQNE